jgi:hypothetical protein
LLDQDFDQGPTATSSPVVNRGEHGLAVGRVRLPGQGSHEEVAVGGTHGAGSGSMPGRRRVVALVDTLNQLL